MATKAYREKRLAAKKAKEAEKLKKADLARKNLEKAREALQVKKAGKYLQSIESDLDDLASYTKQVLDNLPDAVRKEVHKAIDLELSNRDLTRMLAYDMFKAYVEVGGVNRLKSVLRKDPKMFMKFLDLLVNTSIKSSDINKESKGGDKVVVNIVGLSPDSNVEIKGG
jgi:hypothetical protein